MTSSSPDGLDTLIPGSVISDVTQATGEHSTLLPGLNLDHDVVEVWAPPTGPAYPLPAPWRPLPVDGAADYRLAVGDRLYAGIAVGMLLLSYVGLLAVWVTVAVLVAAAHRAGQPDVDDRERDVLRWVWRAGGLNAVFAGMLVAGQIVVAVFR